VDNKNTAFMVDTNTIITPCKKYYPFDLVPSFWSFLEARIKDGSIVILDKVYNELVAGEDDLTDWLKGIAPISLIEHKNPDIIKKYSDILTYIQTCGFYKPKALTEWSNIKVADPWLIASACVFDYTVVTFEEPNGNLSKSQPCSRSKIPDICKVFDVECTNLFEVMRRLSFSMS